VDSFPISASIACVSPHVQYTHSSIGAHSEITAPRINPEKDGSVTSLSFGSEIFLIPYFQDWLAGCMSIGLCLYQDVGQHCH
jgi:hypothetical protein